MAKKSMNPIGMHQERMRKSTSPISVARSIRGEEIRMFTSLPAGKCVPLATFAMLREDAVHMGRVRFSFEMHETAEILMNAVQVKVLAYLVPWLAMDRFSGLDEFNASYNGQPLREGDDVVPFFATAPFGAHGSNDILTYLGEHGQPTDEYNTMFVEAYNQIFNFRAGNASPNLTKRDLDDITLAPAFWAYNKFAHIVPDFDQAKIDGEVPLNVVDGRMPVRGIGTTTTETFPAGGNVRETGGAVVNYAESVSAQYAWIKKAPGSSPEAMDVFAELAADGITVSLANIELAQKTRAFARLREQYAGHTDEYIVNMLMDGIRIPEKMYEQPILVGSKTTVFGMSKRYSTTAGSLDESAVNGATFVDMSINIPQVNTGGLVMFVAEITPEQLFERQKNPFLHIADVAELPAFLRDELDPEKVETVKNSYVDTDHSTPNATFGYAPLNHVWNGNRTRIGGRYYRPEVDAPTDEDRQRLWAVETANPTLGEDFYLATEVHQKPFADTVNDPFECVGIGRIVLSGNTVFGQMLIEASDDYAKVFAVAPTETIDKEA